jgi:Concanavalin A-like lectin/glucanases superfamily
MANTSYRDIILAETGLLNYWRLGEASGTFADSKGTATGTLTGGGTYGQAGAINGDLDKAFLLNGTTGFITAAMPASTPGDTFSIEFWIKRTATGGTSSRCFDRNPSADAQVFVNGVTADHWRIADQATSDIAESTTTLDTNWHHLVWTKAAGTNVMWQDGVDVTGTVTNHTIAGATGTLVIGAIRSGGSDFLNATLDEYAYYSVALTKQQVQRHYLNGLALFGHINTVEPSDLIRAY